MSGTTDREEHALDAATFIDRLMKLRPAAANEPASTPVGGLPCRRSSERVTSREAIPTYAIQDAPIGQDGGISQRASASTSIRNPESNPARTVVRAGYGGEKYST